MPPTRTRRNYRYTRRNPCSYTLSVTQHRGRTRYQAVCDGCEEAGPLRWTEDMAEADFDFHLSVPSHYWPGS